MGNFCFIERRKKEINDQVKLLVNEMDTRLKKRLLQNKTFATMTIDEIKMILTITDIKDEYCLAKFTKELRRKNIGILSCTSGIYAYHYRRKYTSQNI